MKSKFDSLFKRGNIVADATYEVYESDIHKTKVGGLMLIKEHQQGTQAFNCDIVNTLKNDEVLFRQSNVWQADIMYDSTIQKPLFATVSQYDTKQIRLTSEFTITDLTTYDLKECADYFKMSQNYVVAFCIENSTFGIYGRQPLEHYYSWSTSLNGT